MDLIQEEYSGWGGLGFGWVWVRLRHHVSKVVRLSYLTFAPYEKLWDPFRDKHIRRNLKKPVSRGGSLLRAAMAFTTGPRHDQLISSLRHQCCGRQFLSSQKKTLTHSKQLEPVSKAILL
jgi:hypothetical protein